MTEPSSRPLFPPLPPHVEVDPRTIAWEIARTQTVTQNHENRITHLESRPQFPQVDMTKVPWLKVAGLVLLLALGITGHLRPEDAREIGMKLLRFT